MLSQICLVVLLAALAQGAFSPEETIKIYKVCKDEASLSDDLHLKAVKGDLSDPTKELKCYAKCVLAKTQSLGEDGKFNLDSMLRALPDNFPAQGHDAIRDCFAKENTYSQDLCEKSFEMWSCTKKATGSTFYFT